MGIQSTSTVKRPYAINRIKYIYPMIAECRYRDLEGTSTEDDDMTPQHFIGLYADEIAAIDIANIDQWTNRMLEDVLGMPYFRGSLFDNFHVVDEFAQEDIDLCDLNDDAEIVTPAMRANAVCTSIRKRRGEE